jgi:hypothetical protein
MKTLTSRHQKYFPVGARRKGSPWKMMGPIEGSTSRKYGSYRTLSKRKTKGAKIEALSWIDGNQGF